MLTGKLPYGSQMARARTRSQFNKLKYRPAVDDNREVPAWIDGALRRAVHADPTRRYESLSEFTFDLRHPNPKYQDSSKTPLIERNPLLFWKSTTAILALIIIAMLAARPPHRVAGTAVYLTADPTHAPGALLHNLKHNKVLHQQNIILTVETAEIPRVAESDRVRLERISLMTSSISHTA